MQVTIVHVQVKPEHVEEFIEASRLNHAASVQEPGNRRFDVLQSSDDPCRFVLYEAYSSAAEAAKHKQTAHYPKAVHGMKQVERGLDAERRAARAAILAQLQADHAPEAPADEHQA